MTDDIRPDNCPDPYGTLVLHITNDHETAAAIEFIGRYIDDEDDQYPLSESTILMEFLDIYTGVILRELEGRGIAVPSISVYDPRAIKEARAALLVIYHALKSIEVVLDEEAARLNHDHMRELLMTYVGAVCDYYESSGVRQKITLQALTTSEAIDAFNRAVDGYSPGEHPYYFVEHIVGLKW